MRNAVMVAACASTVALMGCEDVQAPDRESAVATSVLSSQTQPGCSPAYPSICYSDEELIDAVRATDGKVFIGIAPVGFPRPTQAIRAGTRPNLPAPEWRSRVAMLATEGANLRRELSHLSAVAVTIRAEDAPRLRRLPFVWYIEPEFPRYRRALQQIPTEEPQEPTDEGGNSSTATYAEAYGDLRNSRLLGWWVTGTQVTGFYQWGSGYKGRGMAVGVVDGEVMIAHPKLTSNFLGRRNYTSEPFGAPDGHATWVAGSIVAPDVSYGTVGVAPEASYYNAKVCSRTSCSTVGILDALLWLSGTARVAVINMSLGGGSCSLTERNALADAVNRGSVIVVAAGESANSNQPDYSAYGCYDGDVAGIPGIQGVISVSAFDRRGEPTTYSWSRPPCSSSSCGDYNMPGPGIGGPGGEDFDTYLDDLPYATFVPGQVLSPQCADYNGDGYAPCMGTSMAAPIVAGIALIRRQQYTSDVPATTELAIKYAGVISAWPCVLRTPCGSRFPDYAQFGSGRVAVNW